MGFGLEQPGLIQSSRLAANWLGCSPDELSVAPAPGGCSTPVYRIERGDETFYLRLAEDAEASLGPEALAHGLLLERGARVPAVIGYAPFDAALGRSVMLTTAIPGASLVSSGVDDPAPILFAAGADLARIHQIPVDGFGWIEREDPHPAHLTALSRSWSPFATELTARDLDRWFDRAAQDRLGQLAHATPPAESLTHASLVHGDFDTSHIFHEGGRYTGVIDFGEMRGAEWSFDLGHLALHAPGALPSILRGYASVSPLPVNAVIRIAASAIRIGWLRLTQSSAASNPAYAAELVQGMERIATDPGSVLRD